VYDVVDDYLVPAAVPLLLLRANVVKIIRQTGPMFAAFHLAALGTMLGAGVALALFGDQVPRAAEVAGVMTASYTGGSVNFVALKNTYQLESELANPLIVADNFIMGGMFAVLLMLGGSVVLQRFYARGAALPAAEVAGEASVAGFWKRKEVSLRDIAIALAVAFAVAGLAMKTTDALKEQIASDILRPIVGNPFVLITFVTVGLSTIFHRWTERIHGAEELGMYFLYLFFFVIGLRADLLAVVRNVPVLFAFCLTMATVNLIFTLAAGRLLGLRLNELLVSVNATLGGAPSAAAMAISRGWASLILPGLLAGIWGYVIGTFLGLLVGEGAKRLW
jgi:uncharacterized membrane protein